MELNKDVNRRDQIIFGKRYQEDDYRYGGIRHFDHLNLNTLKDLINENFIDKEECQNDSPSTEDIYEFIQSHPRFTCHGYAVSISRSDYRVTLEGVELNGWYSREELIDFIEMFRYADELCIGEENLYCWYD